MIQRIQTLFLLIALGVIISLFFLPMISFVGSDVVIKYTDYNPTLILNIFASLICIASISTFKNRILQIRLCNMNSLLLIGFQILLAVKFFTKEDGMIFSVTAVFPIVAAILSFIAMRYVARDEAMVIAASHLRSPKKGKSK